MTRKKNKKRHDIIDVYFENKNKIYKRKKKDNRFCFHFFLQSVVPSPNLKKLISTRLSFLTSSFV